MRTCIGCKFWQFDAGIPDWSDVTPGEDWSSGCAKDHWRLSGFEVTQEQYRTKLQSAQNCRDYTSSK